MYREAGARRGVHFNPERPHSVLNTVERGLKSEPMQEPRLQVHASVCLIISCLWDLTMTIEVATATKRCVEYMHGVQDLSYCQMQ